MKQVESLECDKDFKVTLLDIQVYLGKVTYTFSDSNYDNIWLNVKIVYVDCKYVLTMSGHIGKTLKSIYYSGQIKDFLSEKYLNGDINFAKGFEGSDFIELIAIWNLYHLNDMHPECIYQSERIKECIKEHGKDFFNAENLINILKIPEFRECPICKHMYGSVWCYHEIPKDVINRLYILLNKLI